MESQKLIRVIFADFSTDNKKKRKDVTMKGNVVCQVFMSEISWNVIQIKCSRKIRGKSYDKSEIKLHDYVKNKITISEKLRVCLGRQPKYTVIYFSFKNHLLKIWGGAY